jgi:hypothetical protein
MKTLSSPASVLDRAKLAMKTGSKDGRKAVYVSWTPCAALTVTTRLVSKSAAWSAALLACFSAVLILVNIDLLESEHSD